MEKELNIVDDRRIDGYLIQDIEAYVGKRSEVYIDKFAKLEEKGYSFNWCSTIFGSNWFAYRKMWKAAILFLLFQLISGFLLYAGAGIYMGIVRLTNVNLGAFMTILFAIVIIEGVILGLLGDWIYWKYVKKMLDSNDCKSRNPGEDFTFVKTSLSKLGGTSLSGLAIAYVASLIVNRLLSSMGVDLLDALYILFYSMNH